MARPKKTEPKYVPITKYKATQFLNEMLKENLCVSDIDGKVLNEIMNYHPQLYLQFMSKIERGSCSPL